MVFAPASSKFLFFFLSSRSNEARGVWAVIVSFFSHFSGAGAMENRPFKTDLGSTPPPVSFLPPSRLASTQQLVLDSFVFVF